MEEVKYRDEVKKDRELGYQIRIRHLEKLPLKLEIIIERMDDFERLTKLLQSGKNQKEAIRIIEKYINIYNCRNVEDLLKALYEKAKEFQEEQYKLFESEEIDKFLKEITDGRYPSYFTLNHAGSAEYQSEINGGIYVCTFKNVFWHGENKLYVFGPKNPRFKDYLRKVREAAEEIEGHEFFKGLPLKVTKEQIKQYIESNPDAMITYLVHKNPEEGIKKYGTDFIIRPTSPVGLTRLNGKVKKQNLGELLFSCFMDGILKSEKEKESGKSGNVFKGTYYGRDNIEAITVLYSELPYAGLGDWGGRIEISPNEVSPEVYRDFKDIGYRFGDLAELMIDLRNRKVIFFS